jgi:hypothetical protein
MNRHSIHVKVGNVHCGVFVMPDFICNSILGMKNEIAAGRKVTNHIQSIYREFKKSSLFGKVSFRDFLIREKGWTTLEDSFYVDLDY